MEFVFPYSTVLTTGKPRLTYWHSFLENLLKYTTIDRVVPIETFATFHERGFAYKEIPAFSTATIRLNGYFQSYKYFNTDFDAICKTIGIREQANSTALIYRSLFEPGVHTISMHFRLGDYKPLQHIHPIMPFDYYEKALSLIVTSRMATVKRFRVLYFCEKEDNDTVNETIAKLQSIPELESVSYTKVEDTIEDYTQMLLMSCCEDNIIANSSFSWWGAHFNRNENKMVCYPNKWFGYATNHDVSDLFPPTWHKIHI